MDNKLKHGSQTDNVRKKHFRKKRKICHRKKSGSTEKTSCKSRHVKKSATLTAGRLTTKLKTGLYFKSKRMPFQRNLKEVSKISINEKLREILTFGEETKADTNDVSTQVYADDTASISNINQIDVAYSPALYSRKQPELKVVDVFDDYEESTVSTTDYHSTPVPSCSKKKLFAPKACSTAVREDNASATSTSDTEDSDEEAKDFFEFINDLGKVDYLRGYKTDTIMNGIRTSLQTLYHQNHNPEPEADIMTDREGKATEDTDIDSSMEYPVDVLQLLNESLKKDENIFNTVNANAGLEAVDPAIQPNPTLNSFLDDLNKYEVDASSPDLFNEDFCFLTNRNSQSNTMMASQTSKAMMNPITYLENTLQQKSVSFSYMRDTDKSQKTEPTELSRGECFTRVHSTFSQSTNRVAYPTSPAETIALTPSPPSSQALSPTAETLTEEPSESIIFKCGRKMY